MLAVPIRTGEGRQKSRVGLSAWILDLDNLPRCENGFVNTYRIGEG